MRINNKAEALLASLSFPRRYYFEYVSGRSPGSRAGFLTQIKPPSRPGYLGQWLMD